MTLDELYNAIYDWIVFIHPGIIVIRGNQNIPKQTKMNIVINYPPTSNLKNGGGNWPKADNTGKVNYTNQWTVAITIQEIGSGGDLLQKLIDDINRQDVKDLFKTKKISFLRNENILDLTSLSEHIYEKRASVDIYIHYVNEDSYMPGYIETVTTPVGTYLGKK